MSAESENNGQQMRIEPSLAREGATPVSIGVNAGGAAANGAAAATAGGGAPQQVQVQIRSQPQQPKPQGGQPFSGKRRGGPPTPPAAPQMAMQGPPPLFVGTQDEKPLPRLTWIVWIVAAALLVFLVWSACFSLDEVSTGTGKVVPSSKDQEIQSQDGGTLRELLVKEGDIVKAGQVLARLDPVRGEASVEESASKLRASLATVARLSAEMNGTPLDFPAEVQKDPALVHSETRLYQQSTSALASTLSDFDQQISLTQRELEMTEPLVAQGAASDVEVLRLKGRIADLQTRRNSAYNDFYVKGREDLARAQADAASARSITRGREDVLGRTTLVSPMRGIVKDIQITTIGGVIQPGGRLMSIVPLDDKLLVEARISPRDIAFIHPGQDATVKITAYDYAIYGGLHGKVTVISPDTIQDEVRRDTYYYRVYIRTDQDHLVNKIGNVFPIVPGMITSVDILTGHKSILDYLVKPLNRGREALRER